MVYWLSVSVKERSVTYYQSPFPLAHAVSLVALEGNVTRLGRYANYLRVIIPHTDVSLTEMVAKAMGQLALCEGTYTAEYVEFEIKRALEWLSGNEHKKLAAVLILRELATHTPTLFYMQFPQFFENVFVAVRDPRVSTYVHTT